MLTIAPSCDILTRALIANGLSIVSNNLKQENIIVDFSVPKTEAFWSVYKTGIKYIEDILPVLSGVTSKMLKSFLSPLGTSYVLGLKRNKIEEFDKEVITFLLNSLEQNFSNVIVILPDAMSDIIADIFENSDSILLPFLSDTISARNVLLLSEKYIALSKSELKLLPLKLNLENEFHSEKILEKYELFKDSLSADFSFDIWGKLLSGRFSYKDKQQEIVTAFHKILEGYKNTKNVDSQSISENYFKNEKVYKDLRENIHLRLVEEMKAYASETDTENLKKIAKEKTENIIRQADLNLPQNIYAKLLKELCDDVAGLGVLEDFLSDSAITEIMVNGHENIFIEKKGKLIFTGIAFPDEKRLKTVIDRIVAQIGRHIDDASPIVDARLKDGSRVNAVIRPISLNGPTLTIRKFLKNKLSAEALIDSGSISGEMIEFLKTAVLLKQNIIISGGTGTGKTTLLNAISSFIPDNERLVTIEDSAELQLQQQHVIRLESRPKSTEGTGEISIRRLVVNALRMRPDRIIVGECRAGEALDMLQAMNTGHEGSMSTVHANTPQDAVSRLTTMVLMSGADLPESSILAQIGSAVNVIVQLTRFSDGTRKISNISVLNKINDGKDLEIKNIFYFNLEGIKDNVQLGSFKACGFVPDFIKKADSRGVKINMDIFKC